MLKVLELFAGIGACSSKELALLNDAQKKFVCEYFKESYEVLGIKEITND